MQRGQLYIITGINGVGKQTASTMLMERLVALGQTVERHYGPHITGSAQQVYDSLLSQTGKFNDPYAAALAFFSVHAEVAPHIAKRLNSGTNIILDRGPESTWVYQVVEQRLETSLELRHIYDRIMQQLNPTTIFLLDAPVGIAMGRAKQQHRTDHIQKQSVHRHERRRQAYLHLANQNPHWQLIDANRPINHIVDQLVMQVTANKSTHPIAIGPSAPYNP
jgi:dTMP kinase